MKLCFTLWLLAGISFTTGCGRTDKAPAITEYRLKGEIVALLPERKAFVVRHEEIPGLMPAMTMEFVVSSAEIAAFKVGQFITARLVRTAEGSYRLESLFPYERTQAELVAVRAAMLRQETSMRGRNAYRKTGEPTPGFSLSNQEGRGRDCGIANPEFVSISLDPGYDTPAVLKEYAVVRGIETANFSLLTGPESVARDLLVSFGVIAKGEETIIKHTLSTLLIDERGETVPRVAGRQWRPADFLNKIHPA